VTTALLLISVFYAVIAAVQARRGVTDNLVKILMDLSYFALVAGGFVFVWAEQTRAVAVSFTVAVGAAIVGLFVNALVAPEEGP
jgi:hypothetical protein